MSQDQRTPHRPAPEGTGQVSAAGLFTGLSAFPLTPLREDRLDEPAFTALVQRLVRARADSITALGSTGCYPYLTRQERARVAELAVEHAGDVPVIVGVGGLRTSEVLHHVDAAEEAGAAGLLLAPMSYQPLTGADVVGLLQAVSEHTELPVVLYDNPGTTHVQLGLELYGRITELPGVASVKIPALPEDLDAAREHVRRIREVVPPHVSIGISGDASAARGMAAGCDVWYSVIGGTLPELARGILDARTGGEQALLRAGERCSHLWELFAEHGSLRVVAAIAEQLGLAHRSCLPLPLRGLGQDARNQVARVLRVLGEAPHA